MNPCTRIVTVAARTMARAGKHRDLVLPNDMTGTSIGDCIVEKSGEIRFNFKKKRAHRTSGLHNSSNKSCPCESGEEEACRESVTAGGLQLTHPSCSLRGVPLRRLQLLPTASRLLRGCVSKTLSSSLVGASDLASGACSAQPIPRCFVAASIRVP